ncbi:hypothetical protein CXB51_003834 [Gossypium anomalum]|uniref:Uncharacterized protein n=1 Tax=Gossypium anomalum TaxID=47600 RepID=A0A8J5ZJB2_9ROSI|nr:hypothetical protein CXB51_003834 [Gossypium anomalum]
MVFGRYNCFSLIAGSVRISGWVILYFATLKNLKCAMIDVEMMKMIFLFFFWWNMRMIYLLCQCATSHLFHMFMLIIILFHFLLYFILFVF